VKTLSKLLTGVAIAVAMAAAPVSAKPFKWAFQGDAQGLDPHGLNETFSLGFLGNVYEGMTAYDGNLQLVPALATSWKTTSPTVWLVKLREGVKFHNGNDFNADDVIFSWKRTQTEGSDQKTRGSLISKIVKIDDFTIELHTAAPLPVLMQEMTFIYIMDKEWSEANNATKAANVKNVNEVGYANQNANGTGPFMIVERQPGVKTTFKRFDGYWNKNIKTNVTSVEFTPIKEAATRVAALISRQIDMVYPVPVQDWKRLGDAEGVRALTGPEARTIFLGMDQFRDELLYSNIKGKNPLKDKRVRQAIYQAIDVEAIKSKVMRGTSIPAGLLVAPELSGFDASLNDRLPYDPEKSKALLAEAGYPDGFEIQLDCPNNRYVNDEQICQAVTAMVAKAGIKMTLLAQPKSKFFQKLKKHDISMYLLGWTADDQDVGSVIAHLMVPPKDGGLAWNGGGYGNPRVTELSGKIGSEIDPKKRQAMISEALKLVKDDIGYIPLHQQPLSWGVAKGVTLKQRGDNALNYWYINIK